jgi:hypothetical protein
MTIRARTPAAKALAIQINARAERGQSQRWV